MTNSGNPAHQDHATHGAACLNELPDEIGETGSTDSSSEESVLPGDQPVRRFEQEFVRVLQKLDRAWQFSRDCDRSHWDFAVELTDLAQDGVSHETLRWMIGKELIEHAIEAENHRGIGRSFESPGGFKFSERSCFVITPNGHEMTVGSALTFSPPPDACHIGPVPVWDDQRHELRLGAKIVKRFKWRASNQEAVLAAFQEEGWPPRIDDPLPPVAETDPKRRLSDAIKCLNRKQKNPLLRFSGDGTGEGILWDVVSPGIADKTNGAL